MCALFGPVCLVLGRKSPLPLHAPDAKMTKTARIPKNTRCKWVTVRTTRRTPLFEVDENLLSVEISIEPWRLAKCANCHRVSMGGAACLCWSLRFWTLNDNRTRRALVGEARAGRSESFNWNFRERVGRRGPHGLHDGRDRIVVDPVDARATDDMPSARFRRVPHDRRDQFLPDRDLDHIARERATTGAS